MDIKNNQAKWIWKSTKQINDYCQFRREFIISESIEKATFMISCDTDYAIWINEQFVACGQYQSFAGKKSFDSIDVSKFLTQGKNCICILVYYQGVYSFQYLNGEAGLLYELSLNSKSFIVSNEETYSRQDPCYKTGETTRITRQLGFNFEMDSSGDDAWKALNYVMNSEWKNCQIVEEINDYLYKRPVEKLEIKERSNSDIYAQGVFIRKEQEEKSIAYIMQTDFLSARNFNEIFEEDGTTLKELEDCDGIYIVYDMGREETGILEIEIEASKGTIFDIAYGEHLEDLRIRSYVGNRNFANRYIAKDGKQKFNHYFTRLAGRYVSLHISNIKKETKVIYAGIVPTEYPVQLKGAIDLNNCMHNDIYQIAVRTLHLSMHEHYDDPWREQALYAMDSRNEALCGYYSFGEYDFSIASFRLLADGLREDGLLTLTAPSAFKRTIPVFTMMWIVELYEYVLYSGNIKDSTEFLPMIENILNGFLSNSENGLALLPKTDDDWEIWNFYDWGQGLTGIPELDNTNGVEKRIDAPYQLFLCLALKAAIKLLEYNGLDYSKFAAALENISIAFNEKFYNEKKKAYCTYLLDGKQANYSELVQALALVTEVCPAKRQQDVRRLLSDTESELVKLSLSHSIFKFDALMQEPEKYAKTVIEIIEKDWGHMLKNGATTFWETIKGAKDFANAGSLCHGWSAVPIYFYFAYIAGVKPTEPGFKSYIKKPMDLFKIDATIPTPNGVIEVNN